MVIITSTFPNTNISSSVAVGLIVHKTLGISMLNPQNVGSARKDPALLWYRKLHGNVWDHNCFAMWK